MTGKQTRLAGIAVVVLLVLAFIIVPVAADRMTREEGTDHDGNDYNTLFPGSPGYEGTPDSCSAACLNDPACNAATYLPRDQSCWLKQTVPAATARPGVTSFVKVRGDAEPTQAAPSAATTKKSPGFEVLAGVLGCLGVLALRNTR
jgi:hypothetical protein